MNDKQRARVENEIITYLDGNRESAMANQRLVGETHDNGRAKVRINTVLIIPISPIAMQ